MGQATSANRERVVILGASNVSRSIETLVGLTRQLHPGPLEILVAAGHGRSYGNWSSILGRSLPAIRQCGLWERFDRDPDTPTWALVTDIGNDLLYDETPEQIAAWVRVCVERLRPHAEQLVITSLPIDNLASLSEWWFLFMRSVQFPRCRLDLSMVTARAIELNERVAELAREFETPLVKLESQWYGMDPVHFRFGNHGLAWRKILAPLVESDAPPFGGSWLEWLYCLGLPPSRWYLLRREITARQPCGRFSDGSTVALY